MSARPWLVLAAALWLAALGRDAASGWIDATALPPLPPATGAEVVARDGTLLRAWTVGDGLWRLALDPGAVDPGFVAALLAYEDRRFARHPGIDVRALARAAGQALAAGRVVSGGSTLSMQVARLLERGPTGTWAGKLRQMRVALALERRLGKDGVLALYLALAPYGGNIEGLRAASLIWLGHEPRRLTPAEIALLVALPQAPEARRPDRAPAAARAARDRVLARMQAAGLIDAAAHAAARDAPVPAARRAMPALAPHLAARLRAAAPGRARHPTTLDARLQAAMQGLAARAVAGRGGQLSAAIVVADHGSGEILAEVGSAGWLEAARAGFVDMAVAPRSPGSTLKPFVYALAFDAGLAHPATVIEDRPVAFGRYRPTNFDGAFRGPVTLAEALRLSLNTPVVQVLDALGPARLMAGLRAGGAQPVLPEGAAPGLGIALGGLGLSLRELAGLYAGLAAGGEARVLRAVPPAPTPALAPGAPPARFLSAAAAWQVADILATIPPPPGSAGAGIAWKTGTSYGHRDALAVGFDGAHVVAVWLGRADGTPVPGAFGAGLAAPVLFEAFGLLGPRPVRLPPAPPGVLYATSAALPAPLAHFRGRDGAPDPDAPRIAFPPDGAVVEPLAGRLLLRVEGGQPPFAWLADGAPLATGAIAREATAPAPGPGFTTLTVIDGAGRAARATVRLP